MSRSRKYPVVKCGFFASKAESHRKIRRAVNQQLSEDTDILPVERELTNQYDIADFISDCTGTHYEEKAKRK